MAALAGAQPNEQIFPGGAKTRCHRVAITAKEKADGGKNRAVHFENLAISLTTRRKAAYEY